MYLHRPAMLRHGPGFFDYPVVEFITSIHRLCLPG